MEIAPNGVFSVVPPVGGGVEPRGLEMGRGPLHHASGPTMGSEMGRVPLHHPLDGPAGAERPLRVPHAGEELPILTLPQLAPTRHRDDGWTAQRQRDFLENLASCGSVSAAARSVGMSRESAYALRRRAGARAFAQAWDAARLLAAEHLVDLAWDRASQGVLRPVYYHGELMGEVRHYDNRLLLGLIAQNRSILEAQGLVTAPAVLAAVAGDWEAALDRAERGEALEEVGVALEPVSAAQPEATVATASADEPYGPPLTGACERDGSALSEAQVLSVGFYEHWWDADGERWLTNWPLPESTPGAGQIEQAWAGEEVWVDDDGAVLGPYDEDAPAPILLGRAIDRYYARTLSAAELAGLESAEARAEDHAAARLQLYRRSAFGLATPAERAAIAAGNDGEVWGSGAG